MDDEDFSKDYFVRGLVSVGIMLISCVALVFFFGWLFDNYGCVSDACREAMK